MTVPQNQIERKTMKVMFQVECEDWARWKKAYDAHAPKREGFQKDIFVGHEAENPNNVLMICEIPSMEELQEFMQLPENASAIADSGAKLETFQATPLAD